MSVRGKVPAKPQTMPADCHDLNTYGANKSGQQPVCFFALLPHDRHPLLEPAAGAFCFVLLLLGLCLVQLPFLCLHRRCTEYAAAVPPICHTLCLAQMKLFVVHVSEAWIATTQFVTFPIGICTVPLLCSLQACWTTCWALDFHPCMFDCPKGQPNGDGAWFNFSRATKRGWGRFWLSRPPLPHAA